MRKQNIIYLATTIALIISCSKAKDTIAPSDTTPPTITMLGKNPDTLIVKTAASYPDPGATAVDDKDGNITNKIVVAAQNFNVATLGSFIIYYSVEDNAHNFSDKLKRTVAVVKADAAYDVTSTCLTSASTITISSSVNYDTLTIHDFYTTGSIIKASLSNYKFEIVPYIFPTSDTLTGTITASGTTLNGNFTVKGPTVGTASCTATFIRH